MLHSPPSRETSSTHPGWGADARRVAGRSRVVLPDRYSGRESYAGGHASQGGVSARRRVALPARVTPRYSAAVRRRDRLLPTPLVPRTYDCTRWFQVHVRHTSTTNTLNSSYSAAMRLSSSAVRADPAACLSSSP